MRKTYTILVIDDDPDDLELISEDLTGRGHTVTPYSHINQFFNRLRIDPPDAVLIDMVNYEQPGREVCGRVKRQFGTDIKIIAMSGILDDEDINRMNLDLDGYLTKPFIAQDVEEILGGQKPQAAAAVS